MNDRARIWPAIEASRTLTDAERHRADRGYDYGEWYLEQRPRTKLEYVHPCGCRNRWMEDESPWREWRDCEALEVLDHVAIHGDLT